ncbi:MAG: EAL domain-containing protein [Spirochaetaceae bacterium]|nr:EAL domain-containing protein [Spirochaetaceae bacterium]
MSNINDDLKMIYIARQPILNKWGKLVAYELLFRRDNISNKADVQNATLATVQVMEHASNFGLTRLVGSHNAYINCNRDILMSDILQLLDPQIFVLEILEDVQIDPILTIQLRKLKEIGYKIALDDFVYDEANIKRAESIMNYVDIIKIDLGLTARDKWKATADFILRHGKKGLAEKVESQADFELCKSYGFMYFQGYFFARPEMLSKGEVDAKTMEVLKILNTLNTQPDMTALEKEFKSSPALTLKLLSFVNSAYIGIPLPVQSIKHALAMFGLGKLERWLSLMLYSRSDTVEDLGGSPLFENAAQRAVLMESLCQELHPDKKEMHEKAYLTGVISRVDALFRMPMDKALDNFNLDQTINDALLKQDGELGALLNLMNLQELDQGIDIDKMLKDLHISEDKYKEMLSSSYGRVM